MLTSVLFAIALVTPHAEPAAITLTKVKAFTDFRATAIATSRKGDLFAVASEDLNVRLIDVKTFSTRFTLQGHPMTPYAVAFSRDGKFLASGDESARIFLWDTKTGKKIREFPREKGHKRGIQAIAFSLDGKQFASVGKDDVIMVWNTAGGHPIKSIPGNGANFYGVSFMDNGSIATATLAEGMRVFKNGTYDLLAKLKVDSGQGANDLAVNAKGTLGVTGGRDGKVVVWDMKTRKTLGAVQAHSDWVLDVEFTPNGRVAVSCSTDSNVCVIDTSALKTVATISGRAFVDSLVGVMSDGKYLLTTDGGNKLEVYQFDPPQK